MPKPFSIQAPEDIAKTYAGDKARIAEAAQLGIVDPTAAVLAGMFIDRMRSAQGTEGANPPTVAQQVLGPQQPQGMGGMPPPMGMPQPQGMGAMPPPPMGDPGMAPEGAPPPMGMAEGGLAGIDVPDTMFDEPSGGGFDDGFAVGGLVAFGSGGMADLYDAVEWQESRGRHDAVSPKGARGVMQIMPGTMRDPGFGIAPMRDNSVEENRRVGRQYLDAMYKKYGDRKLALMAYNWGPGNVDKWLKNGADPRRVPSETRKYVANIAGGKAGPLPERNMEAPEGRRKSFDDQLAIADERFAQLPDSGLGELAAYYKGELAPEKQEKTRKEDMWMALAQLGANMAASKSPYFLQAAGEAIAATLPGVEASKKERKAAEKEARLGLREVLGLERGEQKEVLDYAKELHAIELGAESAETERRYRSEEAEKERNWRSTEANKDRAQQEKLEGMRGSGGASGKFQLVLTNHYNYLKQLNDRGMPITTPDGKTVTPVNRDGSRGKKLSDESLWKLATQYAYAEEAKLKAGSGSSLPPGLNPMGATPPAGSGLPGPQVVDTDYGSM